MLGFRRLFMIWSEWNDIIQVFVHSHKYHSLKQETTFTLLLFYGSNDIMKHIAWLGAFD